MLKFKSPFRTQEVLNKIIEKSFKKVFLEFDIFPLGYEQ